MRISTFGYGVAALAIFAAAFYSTRSIQDRELISKELEGSYQATLGDGPELLMVYFGALACAPSNTPGLPEAIETMKLRLEEVAEGAGMQFSVFGVALDGEVSAGLEHLGSFGDFDEISVGGSWSNSLALDLMWADHPVSAETPQVVVFSRDLLTPSTNPLRPRFEEVRLRFLTAIKGPAGIAEWARTPDGADLVSSLVARSQEDPRLIK